jgi:choline-sulfatase
VDLLPTLLDLATHGKPPELADHCDGRSLAALLRGADPKWPDEALVEFTAEGVHAPALILRRGRYKYVYCEGDPGMLFDLESDPTETRNLCIESAHRTLASKMEEEIRARCNPPALKEQVLASQRRRLFLHKCLTRGVHSPWDYQARKDASRQYVRSVSTTSTTATKARARFPFVPAAPPDTPRRS